MSLPSCTKVRTQAWLRFYLVRNSLRLCCTFLVNRSCNDITPVAGSLIVELFPRMSNMFVIYHSQHCLARTEVWVVLAYLPHKRCLDSCYIWKNCVAAAFRWCYDLLYNATANILVCQRKTENLLTTEVIAYNYYCHILYSGHARNAGQGGDS